MHGLSARLGALSVTSCQQARSLQVYLGKDVCVCLAVVCACVHRGYKPNMAVLLKELRARNQAGRKSTQVTGGRSDTRGALQPAQQQPAAIQPAAQGELVQHTGQGSEPGGRATRTLLTNRQYRPLCLKQSCAATYARMTHRPRMRGGGDCA